MGRGNLPGHHQLNRSKQALCDPGLAPKSWVFQYQHPAFCLIGCDQARGLHEDWSNLIVIPDRRYAARFRFRRYQLPEDLPQWREVKRLEPIVEFLQLLCRLLRLNQMLI